MKQWFYNLKFNHYEWARIWVTADGMISICSDYGNYGYWFGAPGSRGIRQFLAECDPSPGGYMAIKLAGGEREYDDEATLKHIKQHLIEYRHEGHYSAEFARSEWQLLEQHGRLEHRENFGAWYQETELQDAHEHFRDQIPGQLQGFMTHAWPVFVRELKTEIEKEEAHVRAWGIMQEMGV